MCSDNRNLITVDTATCFCDSNNSPVSITRLVKHFFKFFNQFFCSPTLLGQLTWIQVFCYVSNSHSRAQNYNNLYVEDFTENFSNVVTEIFLAMCMKKYIKPFLWCRISVISSTKLLERNSFSSNITLRLTLFSVSWQ